MQYGTDTDTLIIRTTLSVYCILLNFAVKASKSYLQNFLNLCEIVRKERLENTETFWFVFRSVLAI